MNLPAALKAHLCQSGPSLVFRIVAMYSDRMGVITSFLPFLVLFAALIRLQRGTAPAGTRRVPGGPRVAVATGALGFASTLAALGLAVIPSPGTPHPSLAILKVVGASMALIAAGAWIFAARRNEAVAPRDRIAGAGG